MGVINPGDKELVESSSILIVAVGAKITVDRRVDWWREAYGDS
jgi:inner membrane protein involved in colicin E2 resistance